jgi:hypothetical protein
MFRPIIALVLSLLLAACGGGGDSGQPFIPPSIAVTNGGASTTEARAYLDIYGQQDAMPLTISVSVRTGSSFSPMNFEGGLVCIREYGSTSRCGSVGTVTARMPAYNGGDFNLPVSSFPSVRTLRWGERLTLEIIVDNTPDPWYRGDTFTLWVTRVSYDFDLDTYTLDYSGASTTFSF